MSGRLREISSTFDSPRSDTRGSHSDGKASKSAGKEENRYGLGSGEMFGSKKGRRKSLPAVNRCAAIDVRHNTQKIPVRIIPGEASADAKNREKQQQSKKPIQLPHKPAMSVPKKRKTEFIDDEEDDPTDISSFPARSAPSSLKRDEDSEPWHDGATVPKAKKGRADGDGRDNANGGRGGRGGRPLIAWLVIERERRARERTTTP